MGQKSAQGKGQRLEPWRLVYVQGSLDGFPMPLSLQEDSVTFPSGLDAGSGFHIGEAPKTCSHSRIHQGLVFFDQADRSQQVAFTIFKYPGKMFLFVPRLLLVAMFFRHIRFRPGGGQQDRKQVHQDEPACTAARQAMDIPNFHLQDPFASSDSSACCTVSLPQHALSVFVLCLEIMIKRVKHLRESQCFFPRGKVIGRNFLCMNLEQLGFFLSQGIGTRFGDYFPDELLHRRLC